MSRLSHFVHGHFLWLLLGAYALAALVPGPGLALGNISLGRVSVPMLLLAFILWNAGLGVDTGRLRQLANHPLVLFAGLAANLLVPLAFIRSHLLKLRAPTWFPGRFPWAVLSRPVGTKKTSQTATPHASKLALQACRLNGQVKGFANFASSVSHRAFRPVYGCGTDSIHFVQSGGFMLSLLNSSSKRSNGTRFRRPAPARSRKTCLQVEALEERAVPTIVIQPYFSAETIAPGSTNDGMQHPTVNLVFSGSYWNTAAGQQDENTLVSAAQSLLSGPYLSGLTQYGSDGTANFGQFWTDPAIVPNATGANGPSQGDVQSFLQNSIGPGAAPGFYDWQHAPIYVVVSDPASSGLGNGWNAQGTYGLFGLIPENMHMIWVSTTTPYSTGPVSKDAFTNVLSHELAETISDPDGNGIRIIASPLLPPWLKGGNQGPTDQIADNEPDQGRYLYRVNGDLVQAYWSNQDQAFIVPDTNVQKFTLSPVWEYQLDGDIWFLNFNGKYSLSITGDQLGANYPDNIVIGGNGPFAASVTMNNETAVFTDQTINAITVNSGDGINSIQVDSLPSSVKTLNLNNPFGASQDSIVIGSSLSADSLVGLGATININYSLGQASVFIDNAGGPRSTDTITDHSVTLADPYGDTYPTINYDAGFQDALGNLHGVAALTVQESLGSTIDAESVGAFTTTSVYWQPTFLPFWIGQGWLTGPAASQVNVIGPFTYEAM
jgi:hypothetical protein